MIDVVDRKEFIVNVEQTATTPIVFIKDDDGRLLIQVHDDEIAIPEGEARHVADLLARWYSANV